MSASPPDLPQDNQQPVALITGAARRIGACIALRLHQAGYRVVIHYQHSHQEAQQLAADLNLLRPDSAVSLQADLCDSPAIEQLALRVQQQWQRLDLLVNNASSFYPTPIETFTEGDWDALIGSNLKAPLWLSRALLPALRQHQGSIVNIVDVHAQRPLQDYPLYSVAKAGLAMLTQSLAKELAPLIRVNGVAPGPILPPEGAAQRDPVAEQQTLDKTLLRRYGTPNDIADTVLFLAQQAFITGQIIAVDGGKSIHS
ncbi:MAG: pteridine reductase [Motiliproteus sp.]|jgi:pteridine reductase